MRPVQLGSFVLTALSVAAVTGAMACTAAGSSTIIQGGEDGGGTNPFDDIETTSDGGTTTAKDAGADPKVDDYEALFGPPSTTTTTPDSLRGLWAGMSTGGYDMRIRFGSSTIVVALQCSSGKTIGMSVAANVSSSTVKTLESKTMEESLSSSCRLSVKPSEISSCGAGSYPCFALTGTKLDLDGFLSTSSGTFTKLSD